MGVRELEWRCRDTRHNCSPPVASLNTELTPVGSPETHEQSQCALCIVLCVALSGSHLLLGT